jgi:transposase
VIAIVADARKNGLRGEAPRQAPRPAVNIPESKSVCPRCHTYCNGDCQA